MMTYHSDKKNKEYKKYLFLFLVFAVLFFTPFLSWLFDLFERPLIRMAENTQSIEQKGLSLFKTFSQSHKNLKENEALKKEIERLRVDNMRVEYLEGQVEKTFLKKDSEEKYFSVVGFNTFPQSDSFIINGGKEDGVTQNDIVIAESGFVVGYVADVYTTSSRVHAYSYPGEKLLAFLHPLGTQIQAEGYGNGAFRITASRDLNIQIGDIFISNEIANTPVALVRNIEFDPQDAFQSIYLSYPESLLSVQHVRLVKNTISL
jgi:cell shape-determining protein MreC